MSIIAAEIRFGGGTLDQYDQVIEKLGFERHGKGAPGGLFHWVTKTEDGLKIVDVWESAERFQEFADAKIGPITQDVGMSAPEVAIYPVHNYLSGFDL